MDTIGETTRGEYLLFLHFAGTSHAMLVMSVAFEEWIIKLIEADPFGDAPHITFTMVEK